MVTMSNFFIVSHIQKLITFFSTCWCMNFEIKFNDSSQIESKIKNKNTFINFILSSTFICKRHLKTHSISILPTLLVKVKPAVGISLENLLQSTAIPPKYLLIVPKPFFCHSLQSYWNIKNKFIK